MKQIVAFTRHIPQSIVNSIKEDELYTLQFAMSINKFTERLSNDTLKTIQPNAGKIPIQSSEESVKTNKSTMISRTQWLRAEWGNTAQF